jgi:homoserine dehydrogenase
VKTYKLAIIGFGNVGQGLIEIISEKRSLLNEKFGIDLSIVAVCDLYKGSIANSAGLDSEVLLSDLKEHGDLKSTSAPMKGWNAIETINNSGADIFVELAFTDLQTGDHAVSHVKQAINNGMHVSMTNKGPVALHFPELRELASSKNVQIGIEGTVMSDYHESVPSSVKKTMTTMTDMGWYAI